MPVSFDTTYPQVVLLLWGHGLLVFLEDTVSILDLSVRVLAGNFRLECHLGNSSFYHLREHDLLLLVVSSRFFALASLIRAMILLVFDWFSSVHPSKMIFNNILEGLNNSLSLLK